LCHFTLVCVWVFRNICFQLFWIDLPKASVLKAPADEPVYQFLDKKCAEGKPYFVYMTAAQNKFLRIYYARVKECLLAAGTQKSSKS
ncbi:MAG: hypothetical protein K2O45_01185, partial [Oscillospiraceae bacterium]|nr:hypothetical protein [Oscillospiraceae bacterium]